MKKLLTVFLCAAMLASTICMLFVSVSAGDGFILPELIITEMDCNPKGTDYYEYIEIANTTQYNIDLYEYVVGYCGDKTSSATFEKTVVETTPIKKDWLDITPKSYDAEGNFVTNSYTTTYQNPESGIIGPGEVAILWFVNGDCYTDGVHSALDFRTHWSVPENVKIFAVDGNGDKSDRNFNMKNKDTGTYIIMKYDETVNTLTNTVPFVKTDILAADGTTVVVPANNTTMVYNTTNGYMEDLLIVTWATLNFNNTDSECYKLYNENGGISSGNPKSENKSLALTYDITNAKRAVPAAYGANTVGVLSDAQKTLIATYGDPVVPEVPEVTEPTPDVTEPTPDVTEPTPEETTPAVTEPEVTEPTPEETTPAVTEPEATEPTPEETTPAVTEPEATEPTPEETTPVVTEPEATEPTPEETTPVVTEPEATETTPAESDEPIVGDGIGTVLVVAVAAFVALALAAAMIVIKKRENN